MLSMKRALSLSIIFLAALFTLATTFASIAAPQAVSSNPYMTAYALPDANSAPLHIVTESPSRAWFTLPGIDAIGRLAVTTTVDFEFTIYDQLPVGSEPYDIALSGNYVWFTLRAADAIGRLNISDGTIISYSLPAGSAPTGIDVAPNGLVWFAQPGSNSLGQLNPADNTLSHIAYPQANAQLHDVEVQNNSSIWVTAAGRQQIGLYDVIANQFLPISTAETGSAVNYMVVDGNVSWISASNSNRAGRYAPGTLSLWRWYTAPMPASGLADIAFSNYSGVNRIWIAQKEVNRIWLLESGSGGSARFSWSQPLPSPNSQPTGISVSSNGTVWLTAPGSNQILTWSSPYFDLQQVYLPIIIR
jgi:streptogramin lyase